MSKEPLMESEHGYFTTEQIDEQIDQLRRANTTDESKNEARLVYALQRYHSVSLQGEDRDALERARQRLARAARDTGSFDNQEPLVTIPQARPLPRARDRGFVRVLSGLAAVVLVGILLGSWLVVTHMVSTRTTVIPEQPSDLYVIHSGTAYRLGGKSGKVIWQRALPVSKQSPPGTGGSASLQVVNHRVYAVLDFDIYALDAATGKPIWHAVNHTDRAYFYFVVGNGRLYLFSLDSTFSALNAATGSLLWHNTTFKTENGYGFSVINGNLYTGNSDDNQINTLDAATGRFRWSQLMPQGLGAPLVENGVVYVLSGDILYAVREQNGQRIWAQTIPGAGALTGAYSPDGADGILYINTFSFIMESSTDIKNIFALDARTGRLLWSAGPGYNTLRLPVTNGLLLAAREHNGVYSLAGLNPRTGKVAWQVPFQCGIYHFGPHLVYPECSAVWTGVIGGKLYLLESDGQPVHKPAYTLKSFDPATGRLLSEHPVAIGQDNLMAIGAADGLLYLRVNVPRFANTIYYDDYVFVAYRLTDGAATWSHTMPRFPPPTSANTSPGTSSPVLAP